MLRLAVVYWTQDISQLMYVCTSGQPLFCSAPAVVTVSSSDGSEE